LGRFASGDWEAYYQRREGKPPRETLLKALELFAAPGVAVDLGCGSGIDTLELLRQGWRVVAIDSEPRALAWLKKVVPLEWQARLEMKQAMFEAVELPSCNLVSASASLPFCAPAHFDRFWGKIVMALGRNGRFAGHFFGDRDDWSSNPEMTFHTADQVQSLLADFEIEWLEEKEFEEERPDGEWKHWHSFEVVARKL
jgi:SAM-dependent methyltransferase